MNEVIQDLFHADLIDAGVRDAVGVSIRIGAILAPLFFLGNVGWNFASTTIRNFGQRPSILFDKAELARACVLWFILTAGYVPIFSTFAKLGEALGRYTTPSSSTVGAGKNKLSNHYAHELGSDQQHGNNGASQPPEQSSVNSVSVWNLLTRGWNTLILTISGAAWGFLSIIVRAVVLMFAIILAKIFYAIGPVVIAFSILPVFKDKFGQWAGVYLNVLCVPFTMNLLDTIIFSVVGRAWEGVEAASPYSITVFGVCMTICYALSFWITSFFCGSSGAAKIMSTAVSVATQAAGMAMSGGAASGGGGSATASAGGGTTNIVEDKPKQASRE